MYVGPKVRQLFDKRKDKAIEIIKESGIDYVLFGLFGSYAREEYDLRSDVDVVVVCRELPNRLDAFELRDTLGEYKVDCTIMSEERFYNEDSLFMRNLRRDFIELERR